MLCLSAAASAHGQVVTISDINDAVASRFFDAATSAPDPASPNLLRIGLHPRIDAETGLAFDPITYMARDFRASTEPFSSRVAMDTVSFRVTAPRGFYISRITYRQEGVGAAVRTGRAGGAVNWVVGDLAGHVGTFSTDPTVAQTLDLTGLNLSFLPVSITSGLFAYSTPQLGEGTIAITSAEVEFELLPLGLPEPNVPEASMPAEPPVDEATPDPVVPELPPAGDDAPEPPAPVDEVPEMTPAADDASGAEAAPVTPSGDPVAEAGAPTAP
jgi:hypothetical protein